MHVENHYEQVKKRLKIYHLQPTGVTYWPRWGKPIFPKRFGVYILIMIILEVASYWGMQWGKKSISLRNIGHQRYLVLDIGAVYGLLTLECTRLGTKGREGVDGTPLGFLFCCNISKQFCLQWKAFDLLYKMRYILWVVELLEVCDVTKYGRHLGLHLGFYQELEIRKKKWELTILSTWHVK